MKFLLSILFLPAVIFAQTDTANVLSRAEIMQLAQSYQETYHFKKVLTFSFTTVVLRNDVKVEGAFLGITPTSLVILQHGKEAIIPGDSIYTLSITDLPRDAKGFAPGFAFGTYAAYFGLNAFITYYHRNYIHGDKLDMRLPGSLLVGLALGSVSELLLEKRILHYYMHQGEESAGWLNFIDEISENPVNARTVTHLRLVTSYVPSQLSGDAQLLIPGQDLYPSLSFNRGQGLINLFRRASFSIAPSSLYGVEIGATYMTLNEPKFRKSGMMRHRDTSFKVTFNSELNGEAYFGTIGYSRPLFKNTEFRLSAGAGKSILDYWQDIDLDYYDNYTSHYQLHTDNKGSFFSVLTVAELSYMYNVYLSLALSGDYVWIKSPSLPAKPDFNLPQRSLPFNTFSLGLSLGFNF